MTKEALELGEQNQHHQASNKRSFTAAAFSPEQTSLIELAVGPSANNGTNNAIDSENNTEYNAEYTFALGSELNRPSSVTASPSHSLSLSLSYSQPATPSPPGSPSYSDTFVYVDNNDGVESGTNDNANDSANNILGAHISKRNLPGSGSVRSVGSPTSSTTTGSATHRLQSVTLSNSNFTSVYSDVKSQFLSPGDVVHLLPSKFWLAFEKHVQYGSAMPGLVDFSRLKAYCEANSNSHGLISASLEDVEGFVLIKSSIFTKLQISFPMFPKDESTRTFPVCIVSALTRDDFKGSFATAKININPIQLRVYKLPVAAFTEVPVAITVASRDWSSDIVQRVVRRHLDAKSVRLFRLDIDTVASTDLSDENFPLLNLPPVQLPGVDYSSLLLGVEISERFDEDEELSCLVLVASAKIPDSNTLLGATKKIDSSNETHSSSLFPLQKKETAQEKRARIRKHEADFANGVESESRDESEIKKPLLLGAADPMDTGVVRIPASDQDYRFPGVGKTIGSVGYSGMTAPNIPARPKTTPGATGLNNLGNTCFMNSALQCLSNSAHLTAFFLSDRWKDELNADNPLGMNGEVARAYAALMRDLWTGVTNNSEDSYYYGSRGGGNSVAPRNFKNTIGRFNQTFVGYSQQDSQELLQFLLDGLHEDLNRILKKPYVEQPDMDGKPDDEIATKAWELYRLRNDSQIVDLFQGEYKSRVECIDCGNWR
ncbi:ubiquitin carboxyl-terminal hydrolase [Physocladia obscura]|uniref:ubiquitinyl hydrolase 1 n=1 Tax=Physocladia obscura TaxID=109957 RepID=A0AAD5STL2_9FUNG|nr:ubiquitin carboxyl-terminal hydrolase [Physocladia obscura]